MPKKPSQGPENESIVLAGGCFWCTEAALKAVPGVVSATSGYAGGTLQNPSYEEVCSGQTGHAEAVQVVFDPQKLPLEKLLEVFFRIHDPTTRNRQGNDVGSQYRSAILFTCEEQGARAREFVRRQAPFFETPIVTEVKPLQKFWEAEERHQDFFRKNPMHPYCMLAIPPKIRNAKEAAGLQE
jgi:peptide-methionine (S)-S-oxide reductase